MCVCVAGPQNELDRVNKGASRQREKHDGGIRQGRVRCYLVVVVDDALVLEDVSVVVVVVVIVSVVVVVVMVAVVVVLVVVIVVTVEVVVVVMIVAVVVVVGVGLMVVVVVVVLVLTVDVVVLAFGSKHVSDIACALDTPRACTHACISDHHHHSADQYAPPWHAHACTQIHTNTHTHTAEVHGYTHIWRGAHKLLFFLARGAGRAAVRTVDGLPVGISAFADSTHLQAACNTERVAGSIDAKK